MDEVSIKSMDYMFENLSDFNQNQYFGERSNERKVFGFVSTFSQVFVTVASVMDF